jgi:hypothetical protein
MINLALNVRNVCKEVCFPFVDSHLTIDVNESESVAKNDHEPVNIDYYIRALRERLWDYRIHF